MQFGGGIYLKVGKEEYKELVENLIKELEELKDSSGNKIIKKVYRKNELWNGSYLDNAPDLVIEADEYDLTGWLGYSKLINTKVVKSGSHRKNGIIILWGVKNTNISDAKIIDVAPTILKLLDLNVPNEMDGKSLIG
jgi:predicted AlkP superfamily phosphohydrolase/phosphomutase